MERAATVILVGADPVHPRVWELRRNCMLGPRELAVGCSVPCVFGVVGALVLALAGYPVVMVFVFAEMAAVGLAFVAYARHAVDGETVRLTLQALEVEQRCGGRVQRTCFNPAWVTVRQDAGDAPLIELCAGRATVQLGRHLPPASRAAMARELRSALRAQAGRSSTLEVSVTGSLQQALPAGERG